jgi:hypothetical protein
MCHYAALEEFSSPVCSTWVAQNLPLRSVVQYFLDNWQGKLTKFTQSSLTALALNSRKLFPDIRNYISVYW